MTTQSFTPAAKTRFWSMVDKTSQEGCWLWTGPQDPGGYGRFWFVQRQYRAHRCSFEWLIGPIPEGLVLDHLCRVRRCVNPAHLEPVTNRENILRGEGPTARNAVKVHCPQGHLYSEANTYVRPNGGRGCRECRRDVMRVIRQDKAADPLAADRAGHGKVSTYRSYKCRCFECREAQRVAMRLYRQRARSLATVPAQTTGRCPVCRGTFEDCTRGGAA